MLTAVPLLNMSLRLPVLQNREFKHRRIWAGLEFLFKNDADTMLFRARMTTAILTLLLALLVFLAGQEMFGVSAGFVALVHLVFDPNQIAHGAFVTTDTGLTCFLFSTVYCFYRYVKQPSIGRLLLVGWREG
jgi:dolichyl-phosphate-mannose--protein O-mannosyl transferase